MPPFFVIITHPFFLVRQCYIWLWFLFLPTSSSRCPFLHVIHFCPPPLPPSLPHSFVSPVKHYQCVTFFSILLFFYLIFISMNKLYYILWISLAEVIMRVLTVVVGDAERVHSFASGPTNSLQSVVFTKMAPIDFESAHTGRGRASGIEER